MTRMLQKLALSLLLATLSAQVSAATKAAPHEETISQAAESAVVKVFSTMRRPDVAKPWAKQAPAKPAAAVSSSTATASSPTRTWWRTRARSQVQGNQSGDKVPATVEAFAPGIDLAVLKLEDDSFFARPPTPAARQEPAAGEGRGARVRFPDRRHVALDHARHRLAHRVRSLQHLTSGLRIQIDAPSTPATAVDLRWRMAG